MNAPSSNAAVGRALLAFTAVLIAAQAVVAGISYVWPSFEPPSSMGLIILFSAALGGGGVFAKAADRAMTGGEKTRFALAATVISLSITAAFVYGMFAYAGVPVTFETLSVWLTGDIGAAADMRNWLWAVIAGVGALTFVTAWFFVGLGARSAIKKRDKLAAKGR
ncbi:MAG: ABZJ_00895 family protein [Paracoccaceae bacterium]